jgi:hypothetical protein
MRRFIAWWQRYLKEVLSAAKDVGFYRGVPSRRPWDAVMHLAVLTLVVWTIPFAIAFFMAVRQGFDAFNEGFRGNVPPGTVFEMKQGRLTTTLPEPVVFREEGLAVVINASNTDIGLAEGESGLVVHADAAVSRDPEGRVETLPFAGMQDFKVTREDVDAWVNSNAVWIIVLAAILTLVGTFLGVVVSAVAVAAVYALFLMLATRVVRRPWGFRASFLVAAYAATLPLLAKAVFGWAGVDAGLIPTGLYWILLGFIVYDAVKSAPPAPEPKPPAPAAPAPEPKPPEPPSPAVQG